MTDADHTETTPEAGTTPDDVPRIPVRERLPVPFFDQVVLAVRAPDGLISLAVKDRCTIVELVPAAQVRRIRAHEDLNEGLVQADIDTGYGVKAH
jgi:hypothetical protein